MKTIYTLPIFIALTIAFVQCNKIDLPIPKPAPVIIVQGSIFPTVDSVNLNRDFKKTYVEEFTGHKCITCPANTKKLLLQLSENPERMIVVAYHAGGFARVDLPKYPTDFQSDYATEFYDFNGMSTEPIPSAIINRREFENFNNLKLFNNATTFWKAPIKFENENTSTDFALGVVADYNDSLEAILIQTSIEALAENTGNYRVLTLLVEDSIVAEQLDAEADEVVYPNKIVTDYMHRHVLRKKLSSDVSISGDKVIDGGLAINEWADLQIQAAVPETVLDMHHLLVVSLLIEEATAEIVQSEETHVHLDE